MNYKIGDKVEVCNSDTQWVWAHITNIRNGLIYLKSVDGDSYVCSSSAAPKDIRYPATTEPKSNEEFIKECEDFLSLSHNHGFYPLLKEATPRLKEATARNRVDAAAQAILAKVNTGLSNAFAKADQRCRHLDDSLLMLNDKHATLEKAYNSMVDAAKIHMDNAKHATDAVVYCESCIKQLSELITSVNKEKEALSIVNKSLTQENEKLRAKIARMRAITFEE